LAGLPPAVVSRAEHLLTDLEAARPALASGVAPNGHEPAPLQASFLQGPSALEEAVAAIDPDGMTPIEAIQKLYELRALGREQGETSARP
ncbi:MAG: hypothetical protein L0027_08275, partial [Candidatus Rokubacteria bacterium]|nr:hypothetical protein [Candidatus Rokubacteria bacterium]